MSILNYNLQLGLFRTGLSGNISFEISLVTEGYHLCYHIWITISVYRRLIN